MVKQNSSYDGYCMYTLYTINYVNMHIYSFNHQDNIEISINTESTSYTFMEIDDSCGLHTLK